MSLKLWATPAARKLLPIAPSRPARITTIVFDDFLQSATSSVSALSDASVAGVLGFYDQLAIEAVVDQVSTAIGPAALTLQIVHSGDGMHWIPKRPTPEVSDPETLSLTGPTYMEIGYDDGLTPTLGFVRIELRLTAVAGPVRAHVRVHVTGNNLREKDFTRAVRRAEQGYPYRDYTLCYPGGSRLDPSRVKELIGYWQYKNQLKFDIGSWAVIVPAHQMVCFNAVGDYILVENGLIVWSSRAYQDFVDDATKQGPPKTPNDPKDGWTLESAGRIRTNKKLLEPDP